MPMLSDKFNNGETGSIEQIIETINEFKVYDGIFYCLCKLVVSFINEVYGGVMCFGRFYSIWAG